MATPRPFGAPTTWTEPSTGEVARQVQKMKDMKNPKPPKAENFFQEAIRRVRAGLGKPPAAKTTPKVHPDVKAATDNVRGVVGKLTGLVTSPGNIATTLATNLTSGEDQRMKWKRLGYPSKEHYDAVVNGEMTGQQVLDGEPVPKSRTGSVDTPTPYPTEAVTKTIKPSRDYQKEASESSGGSGGSERTNSEGLVQYGQTLGGLNTFNKGFLGEGYDLTDIQSTYQSEALPATLAGVMQLEKPIVEGATPTQKPKVTSTDEPSVPYGTQLPEGSKPFASTESYTPYSTGGNPSDAQDGTSPQPDRVERLRQIGFNGADFSGDEPDDSTLVSPMYANKKRNEIRRTFLDYEGSSVKAAVAANAVAGFGKDSNGNPRFNYGGELLNAKEGMEYQAKDAAMRGVDPSEFLQTKIAEVKDTATSDATPEVESPTPAESTFTPVWKTTALPDSGAPKGGWDKHFSDMEKNR